MMGKRERKRLIGRRFVSTYLIVMFLVSGCTDRYGRVVKPSDDRLEIKETHSEFYTLANDSDLPMMYVSEGKIGVSKVEADLEEADAFDLQARAELDKQLADFNACRTEV